MAESEQAERDPTEARAVRKTFLVLMPFLMLIYVLAYIDRVNIGFAALTMNDDLGLTATMFGLASTAFFITYVAFEIPSNVMMARFGARIWFPRIMITWGLVSMATMFAYDHYSLYFFRALLGLAEAGLFPGVIYYMSRIFPSDSRAKANSLFFTALPLALLVAGPLSGLILQMDGVWGLKGWQWLFVLEGLPSVLIGIVALYVLPDKASDVKWLNSEERQALQRRLDAESPPKSSEKSKQGTFRALRSFGVLAFGIIFFCLMSTKSLLGTWSPLIIKEVLATDDVMKISLVSALPPFCAIVAMIITGIHSDRTNERVWHTGISMAVGALGWLICLTFSEPAIRMAGLMITAAGVYAAAVPFWAMVTRYLPRESHAVGIAAVAMLGTLSAVLTPVLIGFVRDLTDSFDAVMIYAAAALALGIMLLAVIVRTRSVAN